MNSTEGLPIYSAKPVIGAKEFRYMAESYNKMTGAKEEDEENDD